ncbi:hypothetical protein TRICI_005479 [Trichomonascus ciferrii]|uniref:Major facilitator superfamily (MFS) profile domain-containing protein n=1 Tax=Trichomonascus ciferrii TaxID=44093 RepID=A0A642USH0_9ASCO|nr:hypothetical protein TRICI_005479 [Trichomonascus ciferrii]
MGEPESKECPCEQISNDFGEKDTEEFPEGGRGWLVLAATFLVLNTTYGMVNAFGVYQLYYLKHFTGTPTNVISLIGSLQPAVVYFSSIPVVPVINHLGFNYSLVIGSLIMIFSLMMLSLCKEIWQIYLSQGILFGFGAGLSFFTAMAAPQEWFKRRRALAVGITASGSSLGGVIWPIAVERLIDQVGFGWTNRIIGFIYIPILTFSCIAIKARLPRDSSEKYMPNWSVLKDWRFAAMCVANAIGMLGLFPPLFYVSTFAERLGARPSIANYILAILNAASLVGRILPPYIADKTGRLNALFPCVLVTGVFLFTFWYPCNSEALLVVFAVLWGMASGTFIALFPSSLGQLFGVKDLKSRLSIFFLSCAPFCLAGPLIAGTFIPQGATDTTGFDKLIIFSGVLFIASSLIVLLVRLSYTTKLKVFI